MESDDKELAFSPDLQRALGSERSLEIFVRNMRDFDRAFCDHMMAGKDFNLKMEIHGDAGRLVWCRVLSDGFDRSEPVAKKPKQGGRFSGR